MTAPSPGVKKHEPKIFKVRRHIQRVNDSFCKNARAFHKFLNVFIKLKHPLLSSLTLPHTTVLTLGFQGLVHFYFSNWTRASTPIFSHLASHWASKDSCIFTSAIGLAHPLLSSLTLPHTTVLTPGFQGLVHFYFSHRTRTSAPIFSHLASHHRTHTGLPRTRAFLLQQLDSRIHSYLLSPCLTLGFQGLVHFYFSNRTRASAPIVSHLASHHRTHTGLPRTRAFLLQPSDSHIRSYLLSPCLTPPYSHRASKDSCIFTSAIGLASKHEFS
ncbi:hypothetical protein JB92DRAFT_988182 [Gautieria morchelliformis]|nr:hypothetical protein JB92DRAFT_988182 [Gautieria morchelliformis]